MHPGFIPWWRHRHDHGDEAHAGHCGPHHRGHGGPHERWEASGPGEEGGGFGVRRPLRFLAYKLELSEDQVDALARVATERTRSAERVAKAVSSALGKIHALLNPKQRADLAYLIRTGALQI